MKLRRTKRRKRKRTSNLYTTPYYNILQHTNTETEKDAEEERSCPLFHFILLPQREAGDLKTFPSPSSSGQEAFFSFRPR